MDIYGSYPTLTLELLQILNFSFRYAFFSRPLLGSGDSSDKSVEELFEKTDASIAQVRSNLLSDATDGAFHFVDASSPDTTFRVFLCA